MIRKNKRVSGAMRQAAIFTGLKRGSISGQKNGGASWQ
jgi:hypothetical protein